MTRKWLILFCDNEHGTGDVCFPDVVRMDGRDIQQALINGGKNASSLRKAAKQEGWGRVNGGDYCPSCMETMRTEEGV
jgi:hypothetical protein